MGTEAWDHGEYESGTWGKVSLAENKTQQYIYKVRNKGRGKGIIEGTEGWGLRFEIMENMSQEPEVKLTLAEKKTQQTKYKMRVNV